MKSQIDIDKTDYCFHYRSLQPWALKTRDHLVRLSALLMLQSLSYQLADGAF